MGDDATNGGLFIHRRRRARPVGRHALRGAQDTTRTTNATGAGTLKWIKSAMPRAPRSRHWSTAASAADILDSVIADPLDASYTAQRRHAVGALPPAQEKAAAFLETHPLRRASKAAAWPSRRGGHHRHT